MPAEFYNRPKLLPGCDFYFEAFWELSSDRQIGMGVGEIPFSAIDRYAVRFDVHGDAFDTLRRVLRSMDAEYRKVVNTPKDKQKTVSAKDAKGFGALLDRMGERAAAAQRPRKKTRTMGDSQHGH